MMLAAKSLSLRELDVRLNSESMMMSFLWERLAEDCPNIEKLLLKDVGLYRFPDSRNKEVEILLTNLKNFKRLNHMEISNGESSLQFSMDHDNPAEQDAAQNNPQNFSFSLKRKFDGSFCLIFSTYFIQHQAEAIDQIKKDFEISKVLIKSYQ